MKEWEIEIINRKELVECLNGSISGNHTHNHKYHFLAIEDERKCHS